MWAILHWNEWAMGAKLATWCKEKSRGNWWNGLHSRGKDKKEGDVEVVNRKFSSHKPNGKEWFWIITKWIEGWELKSRKLLSELNWEEVSWSSVVFGTLEYLFCILFLVVLLCITDGYLWNFRASFHSFLPIILCSINILAIM